MWLQALSDFAVVYVTTTIAVFLAVSTGNTQYAWPVSTAVVLILATGVISGRLFGSGCDLRSRICPVMKGVILGTAYMTLAVLLDTVVWSTLWQLTGWTPMTGTTVRAYLVWLVAGMAGGFITRLVEVATQHRATGHL